MLVTILQEAAYGRARSSSAETAAAHPTEGTAAGGLLPLPPRKRRALCETSPGHYTARWTGAVRKGLEALLSAALDRCAAAGSMQPQVLAPEGGCSSPQFTNCTSNALRVTESDSTPAATAWPLVMANLTPDLSASPSMRVCAKSDAAIEQAAVTSAVELEPAAAEGGSPSSMRRVSGPSVVHRPCHHRATLLLLLRASHPNCW
jgi:hypothetical protein